ncbi:MAG: SMP-30/gluconolactonase/LRE family protein [Tepidisphaeraceae bacterium]
MDGVAQGRQYHSLAAIAFAFAAWTTAAKAQDHWIDGSRDCKSCGQLFQVNRREEMISSNLPKRSQSHLLLAAAAGVNLIPAIAGAQITFMNTFVGGSQGTGNTQLNQPFDVAVGPTGAVYVADSNNQRIQVFNSSGVYQSTIGTTGSSGSSNTQFSLPSGVGVGPTGTIYVADYNNERIQVFNSSGVYQSTIGTTGSYGSSNTQFQEPNGVAVGPTGTVYVADTDNQRIQVFNSSGVYQSTIGTTGSSGPSNTQFSFPTGVGVGPTGTLYVADYNNQRIQVFNSSGTYQSTIGTTGSSGSSNTQFDNPFDVAIGPTGTVYVADAENDRIQVFNSSGVYQSTIGTTGSIGSSNTQFDYPEGVAVAPSGMVYVADTFNNRIQVFFDPSSWTSGTDSFTDPTVGPTSISLGVSGVALNIATSMALVVGNTTTINSGSVVQLNGGSITTTSLVLNGVLNYATGTHSLGTITVNSGGGIAGNAFILNSGESLDILTGGGAASSALTIANGAFMALGGGSISAPVVTIAGQFNYQIGTISSSNITVASSGVILQTGVSSNLTVPVLNIGGLYEYLQGTFNPATVAIQAGGDLYLGNTSRSINGLIQMLPGSSITAGSGQAFTNSATGQIIGAGTITAGINNSGTIQPSGGVLTCTGAVFNSGTILVPTGADGLFENFSTGSSGIIALSGGTFSNNGQTLNNTGQITGSGIIETGGLTNSSTLALSGESSVFGSVTNNSGGLVHLSGTGFNVFYGAVSNSGTLTVDAGASGTIYGAYTGSGKIVDNGSLYLNANSVAGPISGNGNLTIGSTSSGPAVVQLAENTGLSTLASLSLNSGSTLDITNNLITIKYGSGADPITTIAGYIKSGYNGGNWNGPGIISSAAQTKTNGLSYGIGYADGADGVVAGLSSGQIEVMYTLLGDANLDGLVNAADFTILAANFNQPVTGWDQGDFNYDGLVNAADFTDLAANFNQSASGAAVSTGDIAALDAFAAANGISLANVPEPASAGMIVMAGLGILRRRRR